MKTFLFFLVLTAAGITAAAFWFNKQSQANTVPPTVSRVERGDLSEKISAIGKIFPKNVAHVGTDMSAAKIVLIAEGVAIGKEVTKGQLLVKLDDFLAQAKLMLAQAAVKTAEAAVNTAQVNVDQVNSISETALEGLNKLKKTQQEAKARPNETALYLKTLEDRVAQADIDFKVGETKIKVAEGMVLTAQADLKRAQAGLVVAQREVAITEIKAPISGVIIDKKVMNNQIVTPQSTPYLFLIAQDLNQLQVQALVGEADINKIKKGNSAYFKVDAYSDESTQFKSIVVEIGLVPATSPRPGGGSMIELGAAVAGPTFYPVTLDVIPEEGKPPLLPGLTTNLDFVIQEVKGVLHVPNQALAFRPENLAVEDQIRIEKQVALGLMPLWVYQADAKPLLVFARTGASDGMRTEVTPVEGELKEGMNVITEGPPAKAGGLFSGFKMGI